MEVDFDFGVLKGIESGEVFLLNREDYRRLKGYEKKSMSLFISSIYASGYKDGVTDSFEKLKDAKKEKDDDGVEMDFEEVLKVIGGVKGIGEKRLSEIRSKCYETFGG